MWPSIFYTFNDQPLFLTDTLTINCQKKKRKNLLPTLVWSNATCSSNKLFMGRTFDVVSPSSCHGLLEIFASSSLEIFCFIYKIRFIGSLYYVHVEVSNNQEIQISKWCNESLEKQNFWTKKRENRKMFSMILNT